MRKLEKIFFKNTAKCVISSIKYSEKIQQNTGVHQEKLETQTIFCISVANFPATYKNTANNFQQRDNV
jgi:hypothetical protein